MSFHNIPEELYINHILPYVINISYIINVLLMSPKELLLDWIDCDKLDLDSLILNQNPLAIELAKSLFNSNNIQLYWKMLSYNPNCIDILIDNINNNPEMIRFINWNFLSHNKHPKAIELLKENIHNPEVCKNINYFALAKNPTIDADIIEFLCTRSNKWELLSSSVSPIALEILKANITHIDWIQLSHNTSDGAIELLSTIGINQNKIVWNELSRNPNAIKLLKANKDKINLNNFSQNENPEALELLKDIITTDPDSINKISLYSLICNHSPYAIELSKKFIDDPIIFNSFIWNIFCVNPFAIELIQERQHNIYSTALSINSAIFKNTDDIINTKIQEFYEKYSKNLYG